MKSFFKKIALVLTLAMVIGLVPVNTASAAATPGLKYSSKILYVDGDASGKYDDWCWTPSQNTKGYDVSYNVKSGNDLIEVLGLHLLTLLSLHFVLHKLKSLQF